MAQEAVSFLTLLITQNTKFSVRTDRAHSQTLRKVLACAQVVGDFMVTQLPQFLGDSVSESNLNVEKRAELGISTSGQQSAKMLGNRSLIKEGRGEEENPSTGLRRKPDL